MKRFFKWSLIAIALIFIGSQFVRPAKTNPPFDQSRTLASQTNMPPDVAGIFKRSCYDCHSNETTWPWYSNVAPASWFLIDHVNHGREHMNFSDWARYNPKEAEELLEEMCEEVEKGAMPLSSYLILHPDAKLSDQDKQMICDWANAERRRMASQSKPADVQN
jgi:hypothetical protein